MPDGKFHTSLTQKLIVPSGIITLVCLSEFTPLSPEEVCLYSVIVSTGVLTGLEIHPDLDHLEASVKSKLRKAKKERHFHRQYWWLRWWLYGFMFDHRSFWTHAPIISTVGRIIYFLPELFLILISLSYFVPVGLLLQIALFWAIGLAICDLGHIISDIIYSKVKRLLKG